MNQRRGHDHQSHELHEDQSRELWGRGGVTGQCVCVCVSVCVCVCVSVCLTTSSRGFRSKDAAQTPRTDKSTVMGPNTWRASKPSLLDNWLNNWEGGRERERERERGTGEKEGGERGRERGREGRGRERERERGRG